MPSEEEMSSNDQDDFGYFERFRNMPIKEIKLKEHLDDLREQDLELEKDNLRKLRRKKDSQPE